MKAAYLKSPAISFLYISSIAWRFRSCLPDSSLPNFEGFPQDLKFEDPFKAAESVFAAYKLIDL